MLLARQRPQHAPVQHRHGGWPTRLSREALGNKGSFRQIVVAPEEFAARKHPPPADPYLWLCNGDPVTCSRHGPCAPQAALRSARSRGQPPLPFSARGQHSSYADASRPRRRRSAAGIGSGSSTTPRPAPRRGHAAERRSPRAASGSAARRPRCERGVGALARSDFAMPSRGSRSGPGWRRCTSPGVGMAVKRREWKPPPRTDAGQGCRSSPTRSGARGRGFRRAGFGAGRWAASGPRYR
jgi:hypothetical protein